MKNDYLKSLFTKEVSFENDIPLIRRQLLLSKLLSMGIIIFTILTIYHHYVVNKPLYIVIVDLLALGSLTLAFISLRFYNGFNSAVSISSLVLFLFTIMLIIMDKNNEYSLVWSIFFPIFSILTMGHKKGIIFVTIYYFFVFYLAYSGVDIWQEGSWSLSSFFHFAIASTILTYVIFSMEISQEKVYQEINALHDREQEYMDKLEKMTVTDPLTELFNRRHLDKVYKRVFYHAKRDSHVLAFYILDVDF